MHYFSYLRKRPNKREVGLNYRKSLLMYKPNYLFLYLKSAGMKLTAVSIVQNPLYRINVQSYYICYSYL